MPAADWRETPCIFMQGGPLLVEGGHSPMVWWVGVSIALSFFPQPPVQLQTGGHGRACIQMC